MVIRFFGLRASVTTVSFATVFNDYAPRDCSGEREPVDVMPTWMLPVVSRLANGKYELWQTPSLWDHILHAYCPKNVLVIIVDTENDQSLMSQAKEFVYFFSMVCSGADTKACIRSFFKNPRLQNSIHRFLCGPAGKSLTDRFVLTHLARNLVSLSTVQRIKRDCGSTRPPTNEARWNEVAHTQGWPSFRSFSHILNLENTLLTQYFIELLNDGEGPLEIYNFINDLRR